ncbi:MAG: sulfatase-like hydrolase/transferase [Flavobacteriales bacterium]|nr:sulfatase-like hydrolase/transferase [Flavobacteriales bacterium]
MSIIEIVHLDTFKTIINSSTIYIVLESNLSESTEFVFTYANSFIFALGVLFFLSILTGLVISWKQFNWMKTNSLKNFLILPSLLVSILLIFRLRNFSLPYTIFHSIQVYQEERKELSKFQITENGNFKNVKHTNDEQETYVLIIGESTTRNHMGIYGYYRETNPLLKQKLNELYIYKNVISPATFTIESLGKVLTLGDYDVPLKKYNNTLVQLFNSANFKTYFISNQKPLGAFETGVTLISKKSKQSFFTNTSGNVLDEALLKPFQKALDDEFKSKLIIVHLLGTHYSYEKRYPSRFKIFGDQPNTKFKREFVFRTINDYDNALLYNDFIVNSLIEKVKSKNTKSFVLYLSDHGEEVFETRNLAGHVEYNGTEPMYNIPFIVWISDKFKKKSGRFVWDEDRSYNSGELIHTLADLSDIGFERFDPGKSLVNEQYESDKESF